MSDTDAPGRTLLSGSFSFARPTLLCARAHLYEDRLELTGWQLTGRYRRRVPLRRILQVDAPEANCLLLWMVDGRVLRLQVDDARRWQQVITQRLEES
ncbi:MAG: hypothetical protein V5A22_12205 [Salinivenus sp.]